MSIKMLDGLGDTLHSDEQVIQIFETTTALYAWPPVENSTWAKGDVVAITLGGSTKWDGTYGMWAWDETSAAADNGTTVVLPTAFTTPKAGRWILVMCECGGPPIG